MNDQHTIHPQLQRDLMILMMEKRAKDVGVTGGEPSTTRTVAPPAPDEEEPSSAHYLYSASPQRRDESHRPESLQCGNYDISNNQRHETKMTMATSRRPPLAAGGAPRSPASSSPALAAGVHHCGDISPSAATVDVCGVSWSPAASGDERAGTNNKIGVKNTSMPEKAQASYMMNHSTTTSTSVTGAKTKTSEDRGESSGGDTSTLQAVAALLALSTNEEQAAADKKVNDNPDEEKEKTKKTTSITTKDDSHRPNNRKKHHHLTASAIHEMTQKIRRDKENPQGRPYADVEDDSTSPGKYICPNEHDVLSGRGNGINAHPGNQYYRVIIQKFKDSYVAASKRDKASFPSKIISEIESTDPPGRFLRYNPESHGWIEMPKKNAITKTRQVRSLAGCWKRVIDPPS